MGAAGGLPGGVVVVHVALDVRHHALVHRDVDVLAASRLATRFQCQHDAQGGPQAGDGVADVVAHGLGRAVGIAGHVHPARHRLNRHVVGWPVGVRSGQPLAVAITGDAGVDEAGVDFAEMVVSQTQPLEGPGTPVVHQHVRHGHQLLECLLALRVAQVDAEALLVAVDAQEPRAHPVAVGVGDEGGAASGDVARAGPLDLDDLSSHVCQDQRAEGPGDDMRGIQHADAFEWQREAGGHAQGELCGDGHGFTPVCRAS